VQAVVELASALVNQACVTAGDDFPATVVALAEAFDLAVALDDDELRDWVRSELSEHSADATEPLWRAATTEPFPA
jgi:hypothetical protein